MSSQGIFSSGGSKSPLVRSSNNRMLAGLLGGLAQTYGWDVTIVRVIFVAAAATSFSALIWVYLLAWFIVPLEK